MVRWSVAERGDNLRSSTGLHGDIYHTTDLPKMWIQLSLCNRARRQSGFPTFISCQRQDANVLPERRQSHQGDKLCDVSTAPLVARWPVFLARGSDADGEPHTSQSFVITGCMGRQNGTIMLSHFPAQHVTIQDCT